MVKNMITSITTNYRAWLYTLEMMDKAKEKILNKDGKVNRAAMETYAKYCKEADELHDYIVFLEGMENENKTDDNYSQE